MPLFHEIPPRVLVGVLHTEVTTIAWALGLRKLQLPPGSIIYPVAGMPFDHARNHICQVSLDGGFDYCFHLDSDVIPPPDAVAKLLRHQAPIISGVYHRRSPPHGIPVMLKDGQWLQRVPKNKIIDVHLVGAGCMLISTDLLRATPAVQPTMGHHWFSWQSDLPKDEKNPGWEMSEDFVFCRWLRERMQIPILVDTSVRCKHVGYSEAEEHSLIPLATVA